MSKVDVELLYGVSGGGELGGASGQEIAKSLKKIVKGLEKSKIPMVKIFFDTQDLETKLKAIKEKIEKVLGSAGNLKNIVTIQSPNNTGNQKQTTKTLTAAQKRQQTMYNNLKNAIEETLKTENKLYKSRTKNSEIYIEETRKQAQAMEELENKMKRYPLNGKLKADLSSYQSGLSSENQLTAEKELTSLNDTYAKLVKKSAEFIASVKKQGLSTAEAKQKLEDLQTVMSKPLRFTGDATQDIQLLRQEFNKLNATYTQTTRELAKAGELTQTPWKKLMSAMSNKFESMISGLLIATAGRALMQVYNNVVNLDKALTNLQIATGKTRTETKELLNTYSQLAQQLGVTTLEVADAADTWLRQGYSVAETNELIKDTMMLAKLGQLDAAEAAKALTSAIKGYKAEVSDAMSIVDKFTAVDMEAAISAGDIATAMAETAASAEVAGIEMDKLIGYITTVGEVTQDSAESVGTFYKTLFARMGSISAGNFVDSETGEEFNDVEIVLNKLGISLRNEMGTFRDFSTVLDEIADNWDNYSNVQQHAIATAFSGTRQQEKFIVLMENYGTALEYAAVAADSAGTASTKYQDAYMNSIEAKVNGLTAAWQEFSNNLLDSELVKVFVDIIAFIAKMLNGIIKFGNGFAVKAALITGCVVLISFAFKKLQLQMDKTFGEGAIKSFADFVAAIQLGGGKIGASIQPLLKNGFTWFTLLITLMTTVKNNVAKLVIAVVAGIGAIIMAVKAFDKATKTVMATNPIGWILLALTAVVAVVKTLINLFKQPSYEDLKEAAQDAKDAWDDVKQELEEVTTKLEEIQEKIDEINNKKNLTLVDKEQLALLEQEKDVLAAEQAALQQANEEAAKKAIEATKKATEKHSEEKTKKRKWYHYVADVLTVGMTELIWHDDFDTSNQEQFDSIMGNYQNASDSDKQWMADFINERKELASGLEYTVGQDLTETQKLINEYLEEYYSVLDRYNLANGQFEVTWNAIISRNKYDDAMETLKELADNLNVTEESLEDLYNNDAGVKQFIDYLQQLGMFSWDDTSKVEGLVQQIRDLADSFKSVAPQTYLSILSSISDEYDTLKDALDEVNENGLITYDTLKTLSEDYPLLFEQLESSGDLVKGVDGYTLNKDALSNYLKSIKESYQATVTAAEEWEKKVREAVEEGKANQSNLDSASKSVENAKNNLEELNVVLNTLEKTDLIEDFTEKLEKQSDALDDQLDKYKDIVDIRKELLETYQDEIDYQKTLAEKTKNVADLQTRLAVSRLDTSASGRAVTRELESELAEAQEDLAEFNLDHAIEKLTTQLSDEYDEYQKFIDEQIDSITKAIESAPNKTAEELRKLLNGDVPEHHTGGFVGGSATLQSNEEFAKLLKGELVVTPKQMSNFMGKTLPALEGGSGTSVVYQAPLITIQCENVNKDTLPELQKVVDKAVKKVKEEIDGVISRTGKKGNINKFNI